MTRLGMTVARRMACVVALAVVVGACAGAGASNDDDVTSSPAAVEVSPTTIATGETFASTTTAAPTTTSTTTLASTTTSTNRAATADEIAPVEAFVAAYASQDAAAMEATFAGEPEIEFKIAGGNTDTWTIQNMARDAAFSAAVLDTWELDECSLDYGRLSCRLLIQDELGRRLGLEPVAVTFFYTIEGDQWTDVVWDAFDAFQAMDLEAHTYGDWYEEAYPDDAPIQGYHYRAWNVEDPTAGDRYLDALDEYIDG